MFLLDVLCSYRKTDDFRPMERCWKCSHYLRFMRLMREGDEEEGYFVDDVHKYGREKADARARKRLLERLRRKRRF